MKGLGYYNGDISLIEDIMIPLRDRSIFFADAVYEVMVGCNGKIHLYKEHISRLLSSLAMSDISLPVGLDELKHIIDELVRLSNFDMYMIYLQCSTSGEIRRHSRSDTHSNILITISEQTINSSPADIDLITLPDNRYQLCNIKTTNLLPAVLASTKAERDGCAEAILHREGRVTECAHSNIFLLNDRVLYTHPLSCHILPGIIRSHIITLAKDLGLVVKEISFTLDDIPFCDELLVTSSTRLISRARRVDSIKIPAKDYETVVKLYNILYSELTNQE